jgi:hypothetical protein
MNLKKIERYLRVNLLGPGGALVLHKKDLPGGGLTKVEKHWARGLRASEMNCVEETIRKWSYLSEICFYFPIFIICSDAKCNRTVIFALMAAFDHWISVYRLKRGGQVRDVSVRSLKNWG